MARSAFPRQPAKNLRSSWISPETRVRPLDILPHEARATAFAAELIPARKRARRKEVCPIAFSPALSVSLSWSSWEGAAPRHRQAPLPLRRQSRLRHRTLDFTVQAISPTVGLSGERMSVAGTGFLSGATLTLDGVAARVISVTSTASSPQPRSMRQEQWTWS